MALHRGRLVFACGLVGAAIAPWPVWNASAGCVAPYLQIEGAGVSRPMLAPNESVTVAGRAFVDGCDDEGSSSSMGCSSEDGETATPEEDVTLRIEQGDRSWELGTEDAGTADDNQLGHISWTFTVPDGLRPGRAKLKTETSDPLVVSVR